MNFCKNVLDNGGDLVPLILPYEIVKATGIFNPSIYYDSYQQKLLVNIRHCQYTLYHSEKEIFECQWGPLSYLNPENDITLTTNNYLCELDQKTLELTKYVKIDTSLLDVKPIWEFVGLEDARIVRWNDKLYAIGVRRDTTTHGQGRMEFSEIEYTDYKAREISRHRIAAPPPDTSYCEKNWVPIIDSPFHMVKWSNPTEIVSVDLSTNTSTTVFLGNYIPQPYDFRGGSQVIPLNDSYRFACMHGVDLYRSESGRKDATYRHCFAVWDKNWNIHRYTSFFSFLENKIEFCTGMCALNDNFLLSFGAQDNSAYVLKVPKKYMEKICLE